MNKSFGHFRFQKFSVTSINIQINSYGVQEYKEHIGYDIFQGIFHNEDN